MSDFRTDGTVSVVPTAQITVVVLESSYDKNMEDAIVYVFPGKPDRETVLRAIAADMSEDQESDDENSVTTVEDIEHDYNVDVRYQTLDTLPGRDWRSDILEDR